MLKVLQPGIEPLGLFDLEDADSALVKGGEVGFLRALDQATDTYASDVTAVGPELHVKLGDVASDGVLYGLVDEGTSPEYGTLYGTVIGMSAGQGTGLGAMSTTGAVVVGPVTTAGSGKATLWTKPGLYGVTETGWVSTAQFDAASLNDALYGTAEDGTSDGKITTTSTGSSVAIFLGAVEDRSLVSTTQLAAGETPDTAFGAVYLLGVQHA